MTVPIALFDDGASALGSLGDLRAAFDQRLGAWTSVERARLAGTLDSLWPAPALAGCTQERHPGVRIGSLGADEVVVLHGACGDWSRALSLPPGEALADADGCVIAARLPRARASVFLREATAGRTGVAEHGLRVQPAARSEAPLRSPWALLDALDGLIRADCALRERAPGFRTMREGMPGPAGVHIVGQSPATVHEAATIWPGVTLDLTGGPVLVCEGATVRPGSVICGPAAVLAGATVADRALVKARSVIGPMCKVGGEVGSCVFHGHSSKVHDGHLGDAIVGEWVNIGAGTCNSNLLNTYSEVMTRVDERAPIARTGRTFYGCTIADHSKIAILTAIGTGTSIGTGAMVAVPRPPQVVPRFAWLSGERTASFRWGKFEEVMRAAMARRGCAPGPATLDRLRALHAAAAGE